VGGCGALLQPLSGEGNTFIGSLTYSTSSLRTQRLVADGFSAHLASGAVLELDGTLSSNLSGYMVGNPPFYAFAQLWVRAEGTGELEGEVYIALSKPTYSAPANGSYLYHFAGDGPMGDVCFDVTFDGRNVESITYP
jgi:hypothetical protein